MGKNTDEKACRLCLACGVKMHLIDSGLENLLRTILGQNITYTSGLPKYACYECTALLKKFKQFKNKCLTAQTVLFSLLKLLKVVTVRDIKKIDRNKISLQSNLSSTKPDIHSFIKEEKNELDEYDSDPIIGTSVYFNEEYLEDDVPENEDNIDTNLKMHVDLLKMDITDMGLLSNGGYASDQEDDKSLPKIAKIKECKTVSSEEKVYTTKRGRKVKPTTEGSSRKKKAGQAAEQPIQARKENDNFWDLADDFTINILSLEEQKAELEQRKNRDAYKEARYKCELCYKGFTTQLKYLNHITCHNPVLEFECVVCHWRFEGAAALARHRPAHSRQYSCNQCSYDATDILEAKLHRKHHEAVSESGDGSMIMQMDGEPLPAVICNRCSRPFTSAQALMFHKVKAHRRKPRKKIIPPPSEDSDETKSEVSEAEPTGPESDHLDWESSVVDSKLFCKKCNIQFTTKAAWAKHSHKTNRGLQAKKRRMYPQDNILRALESIKQGMTIYKASKIYRIPQTTLRDRIKSKKSDFRVGVSPVFTLDEENKVIESIKKQKPKKIKKAILVMIKELLEGDVRRKRFKDGLPGRTWFCEFWKRHPEFREWAKTKS